jgi:hypothetical protein
MLIEKDEKYDKIKDAAEYFINTLNENSKTNLEFISHLSTVTTFALKIRCENKLDFINAIDLHVSCIKNELLKLADHLYREEQNPKPSTQSQMHDMSIQ